MCNRFFTLCAAVTAGIALLLSGCGKPELVGQWRGDRGVVIDGDDGEVTKTRSPQITGVPPLQEGSAVAHTTFSV